VCKEALADNSVLVCPCDGTVVDIAFDELGALDGYFQKVSIFLSPFDAHVMWVPMAGEVERVVYKPGNFTFAFLPKSSALNEHNDLVIKNMYDKTIKVRQIAGTFARRICCFVHAGDSVALGHVYGMIRLGSRVDIFLPEEIDLRVSIGQKVLGGHTVLGSWQ
jgi:phosphatidylserine decarboxylase